MSFNSVGVTFQGKVECFATRGIEGGARGAWGATGRGYAVFWGSLPLVVVPEHCGHRPPSPKDESKNHREA
ncbi:hypothetical protein CVT26_007810 [Gymnopilus dilepis]|uniref:Uncharacterized protein n=1 Tax=Gymnopilus dilepis TaxID=231916 RepID=A0A409WF08_9AGAR|nr:hypothetical protein CVT26_007810 [Gymnopilus dilepis]